VPLTTGISKAGSQGAEVAASDARCGSLQMPKAPALQEAGSQGSEVGASDAGRGSLQMPNAPALQEATLDDAGKPAATTLEPKWLRKDKHVLGHAGTACTVVSSSLKDCRGPEETY
jgi:hypothetical protein